VASGLELLDLFQAPKNQLAALATDVDGNVIWYYKMNPGELPFPIKLLPNGHMLVVSAVDPSLVPPPTTASNEVREIDLAGNVIYRLSLVDIVQGLASHRKFLSVTWIPPSRYFKVAQWASDLPCELQPGTARRIRVFTRNR
jgi:hypothetical protein